MDAIIAKGTPLMIDGKEYILRRLNITDIFTVAKIIAKVWRPGQDVGKDGQPGERFNELMLAALPECELLVLGFLRSLLILDGEKLDEKDFDELPPDALFDIIDGLRKSEDMKRFFDRVINMMQKMPIPNTQAMAEAAKQAMSGAAAQ